MPIPFIKDFTPDYGKAVTLNETIRRLTANNPSAFTFTGTNSYIIGSDTLAIIDPGPNDDTHFNNLIRSIDNHPVSHIFVTHSHSDHSALAARLSEFTGAIIVAEGAYRPARSSGFAANSALDASCDISFKPDIALKDGQSVDGDGWKITSITTPGHMANHTSFALEKDGILFSGDHIMAWSTTVVAPPEGSMKDYMHSLDKLLARDDKVYLPGHGGAVYKPSSFVRAIRAHRKMRERAIIERLKMGDEKIDAIVNAIYKNIDVKLRYAAALSVLAHMEYLIERGIVITDSPLQLDGSYSLS